ncbi:hypothetical protein NDU88_000688 [Pleurodeles waltl]|uniref:Uncharacterized protein n=1 Tax=Pleurodeles waltl TaxID=8319 RepID=A0AAV7WG82_PLEWA|nr:hypothetical protein NDU88_000688 [Pleurodeles waltl]
MRRLNIEDRLVLSLRPRALTHVRQSAIQKGRRGSGRNLAGFLKPPQGAALEVEFSLDHPPVVRNARVLVRVVQAQSMHWKEDVPPDTRDALEGAQLGFM